MVFQIPIMDTIFMGYWMAVQVRTMTSNVMYNSKLKMKKSLGGLLMMPYEVFLRYHLMSARNIGMLGSGRVRVCDLGDALWELW